MKMGRKPKRKDWPIKRILMWLSIPGLIIGALAALSIGGKKINAAWNADEFQNEMRGYVAESRGREMRQETIIEQQAQLIQMFHGRDNDEDQWGFWR